MVHTPSLLYLSSIILSGVALATPHTSRQTPPKVCTPLFTPDAAFDWNNSGGIGLSDGVNDGSGVIVRSTPKVFWRFIKSNSSPPAFTIQPADNSNLAVGLRANNSLYLTPSKGDGNTRFIIECGDCLSVGQNDCFMKLADKPDLCVQAGNRRNELGPTRGAAGDPLFVSAPCRKDDSQRYNYFKQQTQTTASVVSTPAATTTSPWEHATTVAPPAPTQSLCNPNFEGEGVRVANSAVVWGAPSFTAGTDLIAESISNFNQRLEIRFEQTGSPTPYYIAKSLNGTNLGVSIRDNGNLYFIDNPQPNDARHRWSIECTSFCKGASSVAPGDLSADGCTIKSGFNNKCVQIGNGPQAGDKGDRIFVNECSGTDSQRFNFITSPFKFGGRTASATSSTAGIAKVNLANGDDGDMDVSLKELLRNSYIVIGLLAGALVGLIVLGALVVNKGCLRGRDSKARYTTVSKGDVEGMKYSVDSMPHGRYSD